MNTIIISSNFLTNIGTNQQTANADPLTGTCWWTNRWRPLICQRCRQSPMLPSEPTFWPSYTLRFAVRGFCRQSDFWVSAETDLFRIGLVRTMRLLWFLFQCPFAVVVLPNERSSILGRLSALRWQSWIWSHSVCSRGIWLLLWWDTCTHFLSFNILILFVSIRQSLDSFQHHFQIAFPAEVSTDMPNYVLVMPSAVMVSVAARAVVFWIMNVVLLCLAVPLARQSVFKQLDDADGGYVDEAVEDGNAIHYSRNNNHGKKLVSLSNWSIVFETCQESVTIYCWSVFYNVFYFFAIGLWTFRSKERSRQRMCVNAFAIEMCCKLYIGREKQKYWNIEISELFIIGTYCSKLICLDVGIREIKKREIKKAIHTIWFSWVMNRFIIIYNFSAKNSILCTLDSRRINRILDYKLNTHPRIRIIQPSCPPPSGPPHCHSPPVTMSTVSTTRHRVRLPPTVTATTTATIRQPHP